MKGSCFVCGENVSGDGLPAINHHGCVQKLKNDYDFLKNEHKRLCLLVDNLYRGIPEHMKKHIDLGRMLERQFIKEGKEFFENENPGQDQESSPDSKGA